MKRLGRVHPVIILGIAGAIILIVGFFASFFLGEAPEVVGQKFMIALATHDEDALADLTYLPGVEKDQLRAEWKDAVERSSHYQFKWRVQRAVKADEDTASVAMMVLRNADDPTTFEEQFSIPLIKKDGSWKINLNQVDRRIFPGMPRLRSGVMLPPQS